MAIKKWVKPLLLVLFIIAAIVAVKMTNVERFLDIDHIRPMIEAFGLLAPVVYGILYAIGTVVFLPGTPLSIVSGVLFDSILGTVVVVIGATLGATGAFLLARYLGKDFTERIVKGKFQKLYEYDQKLEEKGFITMLFLRLVPLFPFNGLNFAMGLTKIKFKDFVLGTFIGIIPGSFVLVTIGASATDLRSPKLYIFIGLFLLLALVPGCYKKVCQIRNRGL